MIPFFLCIPQPIYLQILSALPSKKILSPIGSHYLHCRLPSPSCQASGIPLQWPPNWLLASMLAFVFHTAATVPLANLLMLPHPSLITLQRLPIRLKTKSKVLTGPYLIAPGSVCPHLLLFSHCWLHLSHTCLLAVF